MQRGSTSRSLHSSSSCGGAHRTDCGGGECGGGGGGGGGGAAVGVLPPFGPPEGRAAFSFSFRRRRRRGERGTLARTQRGEGRPSGKTFNEVIPLWARSLVHHQAGTRVHFYLANLLVKLSLRSSAGRLGCGRRRRRRLRVGRAFLRQLSFLFREFPSAVAAEGERKEDGERGVQRLFYSPPPSRFSEAICNLPLTEYLRRRNAGWV